MKSRIIVSVLLAVLMLGTLVTPTLAGKPIKTELRGYPNLPVAGEVSYQVTHDNHLKITVVLEGGSANTTYNIIANVPLLLDSDEFTTHKNGRGRFMGITGVQWNGGDVVDILLYVKIDSTIAYWTWNFTTIEF